MNIKQQLEQVIALLDNLADEAQRRRVGSLGDSMIALADQLSTIVEQMPSESAEPVAWMNPLNGVVISSVAEDGSRINLVNMAEYGFDTPLYAAPPEPQVPDGMVLVPEVLLRQIAKWLAESTDPYDKAAYAINELLATPKP